MTALWEGLAAVGPLAERQRRVVAASEVAAAAHEAALRRKLDAVLTVRKERLARKAVST